MKSTLLCFLALFAPNTLAAQTIMAGYVHDNHGNALGGIYIRIVGGQGAITRGTKSDLPGSEGVGYFKIPLSKDLVAGQQIKLALGKGVWRFKKPALGILTIQKPGAAEDIVLTTCDDLSQLGNDDQWLLQLLHAAFQEPFDQPFPMHIQEITRSSGIQAKVGAALEREIISAANKLGCVSPEAIRNKIIAQMRNSALDSTEQAIVAFLHEDLPKARKFLDESKDKLATDQHLEAAAKKQKLAEIQYIEGLSYEAEGNFVKAFQSLDKALEVQPDYIGAIFQQGMICLEAQSMRGLIAQAFAGRPEDKSDEKKTLPKGCSSKVWKALELQAKLTLPDDTVEAEMLGEVVPTLLELSESHELRDTEVCPWWGYRAGWLRKNSDEHRSSDLSRTLFAIGGLELISVALKDAADQDGDEEGAQDEESRKTCPAIPVAFAAATDKPDEKQAARKQMISDAASVLDLSLRVANQQYGPEAASKPKILYMRGMAAVLQYQPLSSAPTFFDQAIASAHRQGRHLEAADMSRGAVEIIRAFLNDEYYSVKLGDLERAQIDTKKTQYLIDRLLKAAILHSSMIKTGVLSSDLPSNYPVPSSLEKSAVVEARQSYAEWLMGTDRSCAAAGQIGKAAGFVEKQGGTTASLYRLWEKLQYALLRCGYSLKHERSISPFDRATLEQMLWLLHQFGPNETVDEDAAAGNYYNAAYDGSEKLLLRLIGNDSKTKQLPAHKKNN